MNLRNEFIKTNGGNEYGKENERDTKLKIEPIMILL